MNIGQNVQQRRRFPVVQSEHREFLKRLGLPSSIAKIRAMSGLWWTLQETTHQMTENNSLPSFLLYIVHRKTSLYSCYFILDYFIFTRLPYQVQFSNNFGFQIGILSKSTGKDRICDFYHWETLKFFIDSKIWVCVINCIKLGVFYVKPLEIFLDFASTHLWEFWATLEQGE